MTRSVTVLITAHNAAATLGASLASIGQGGRGDRPQEIIVVDDRSTDNTSGVAGAASPSVRVLRVDGRDDSALTSRQLAIDDGVAAARNDAILILDADGLAHRGWLAELSEPLLRREADVVAGGVVFEPRVNRWKAARIAALQTADAGFYLLVCRLLNALGLGSGILFGSAGFRRELFVGLGGYREIGPALTEDLAFARAAVATGARLAFRTGATVRVAACSSFSEVVDRALRTSRGGWSALSVTIGVWMLLLMFLVVAAPLAGGGWWTVLAVRYGAGALATGAGMWLLGERKRLPASLVYESAAIAAGIAVLLRFRRTAVVQWGGISYDIRRQPRQQPV